MDVFFKILFMVVVGSIIAGSTNHLAIQMLFRPYKAKYIGKWKVPFTPGLIPKRRDELAIQLGNTVEEYLMTPEMIRKKVINNDTEEKLKVFLNEFVRNNFFDDELSIKDYLIKFNLYEKVLDLDLSIDKFIDLRVRELKNSLDEKRVVELIGESGFKAMTSKIPEISGYILLKGIDFIESEEGNRLIKNMVDDFISGKGKLGGVLNLFVGDSSKVHDKIKKEILNVLKNKNTFIALNGILVKELIKVTDKQVKDIVNFDTDNIVRIVQLKVKNEINIDGRLDKKISDYVINLDDKVKDDFIPKVVSYGMELLDNKIELLLGKLDVKSIVKEQVDDFPVERLEDILLGVSKREFKMITYLGFFLGAIIGLIQGLIVTFL